jgi:hypothetical protein
MSNKTLDYVAFLADLEAKRAALDNTIAAFRNALVHGTLGEIGELPVSIDGVVATTYSPLSANGGEVPAGAFLGKSIPDATKLYLEIVKKKQTSAEIADALRKGGMETNSKNFPQMVHSVLDRARKANTGIVKLDRSHWGLAAWYPASLRVNVSHEKRATKKKSARKRKPPNSDSQNPKAQPGLEQAAPKKANERALELLHSHLGKVFTLEEASSHLGIGEKGVRLILGKLVKGGKVEKTTEGGFRAALPKLAAAV